MFLKRHFAGLRADVDDLAGPLLDHLGRKRLRQQERSPKIDGHDPVPALDLSLEYAFDGGYSRVIDEDIDDAPGPKGIARRSPRALDSLDRKSTRLNSSH